MKTLTELLQSLPPELYGIVYDFTFAAHASEYHVDRKYRPPSCLHVNKSTRETFARSHYGDSIFITKWDGARLFEKWVRTLPKAHRRLLERVKVQAEPRHVDMPFPLHILASFVSTFYHVSMTGHDGKGYLAPEVFEFEFRQSKRDKHGWKSYGNVHDVMSQLGWSDTFRLLEGEEEVVET